MTKGNESPTPKSEQPGIGRSTLINLSGLLVPTVVALITVPLYLKQIGEIRYGVLLLAFTFLGYFGAFDLGLGRAVAQRVARQDSVEERNHTFWTAFIISSIMGLVGAIALYFLGQWLFAEVFNIPSNLRHEMVSAIPWLAAIVPITAIISVLAGALEGRQAFTALNISQIIGLIGLQILPLSAALLGYKSMSFLLGTALIGRFIGVVIMVFSVKKILPLKKYPHIYKAELTPLLSFGKWVTLSGLVTPLLTIIDRVFIGAMISTSAVTAYVVPYNITQRFHYLPSALSTTIFPIFSTNKNSKENLIKDLTNTIIAIQTPIIVLSIALSKYFLMLWLEKNVPTNSTPVMIILLISIWINGPAYISSTFIIANGKADLLAKFFLVELIPFIIILWQMILKYGIIGAALATLYEKTLATSYYFIITKSFLSYIKPMLITSPAIIAICITSTTSIFKTNESIIDILIVIFSIITSYAITPNSIKHKIKNFRQI